MFACVFNGRLYSSIDKGVTWNEQQPAGAVNQSWIPLSVSADGTTVLSGVFGGRLYKMKTAETIATNITATTATGNGTIINLNGGGNATNRGIIFYPYIGSDKIIGDANVTNVSTNGSYGTGAFTASLTGLSPDSRYNIRAHATNNAGTGYSARRSFRTLANVPSAPTVLNPTATSLDVVINANGNPDSTTFVIYETSLEKFVKANGALDTVEIWQKAATWDTVTVTGLTAGVSYTFKVKARNGEKVETAYGDSVSGMPRSIPTVTTQFVSSITDTTATGNGNITATNGADPTIRGLIYYPYTDTDKEIGQTGVTNVADTGTYSTGTFTQDFTGLSVNKRYNVRVHAKNIVGISYGARVDFWTLANVPDPPTVINPAATSLDVAVNVNGNPANTEFAIQDSVNDVYVQGNGTLAATAVWQTASVWDTITVSGLTAGTTYYFRVKARNADSVETDFSLTTARNTCSNPVNGGTIGVAQQICYGSLAETLDNIAHASEYGGTLEYKWQKSTVSDTAGYADIPGAADSIFVPGTLTDTTWFRRLSKVTCKADWTDATPSNVVKITVDPLTIAGSISGDTLVCYGSHSSELILGGYTGVVQKWQYSADQLAWSNIDSSAAPTYTSVNLTAERWYRTVVQSGVCAADTSDAHYINVFADYKISGVARYENNPKTLLSNLKITLKKNGSQVGTPVITGASGAYQFTGLTNGTYSLEVASAHPSGQWQTWGGVNNTDALLVSNHIAGTTPLAVNPPVIRVTASTKVPHPQIANNDYLAIRQAAKYPTTGFSYFDLPKWVFTGTTTTSRIDTFELACANVTRDVRGLCAGDVNGSYVPGTGYKTVEPGLALANQGTLPLTNEIVFPIRLGRGTDIGAITLFMDFNPKLIEITGVEMPENNGVEPWFEVNGGTLYIGWMSTNPISIRDNEPLILVHAHVQTHGNVATHSIASIPTQTIRFTLNDNTISELADADGNVIDRIKLFIPDANGNNDLAKWRNIELVIYPNPTKSTLNIDLQSFNPEPSELTIELVNIHGVTVMQPQPETIVSGWHHLKMDVSDLAPGVYFLKAKVGDEVQMKKIIISR
jgi:hypothetical protein